MKNYKLATVVTILILMVVGCSQTLPVITEGVYPVKIKTLTVFDLFAEEFAIRKNVAEVTEAKPEYLIVDPEIEKLTEVRYGSFIFGNNGAKTWFVMGQDKEDFWSEFYIDQDNDNNISLKEKVKSLQSAEDKIQGAQRIQALSWIPCQIKVVYKGINNQYVKNLYFFIIVSKYSKRGLVDYDVGAITASFFDGELNHNSGRPDEKIKFRIIDGNNNGCFNDYGVDLVFLDLNQDGYFERSESQKLTEFIDFSTSKPGTAIKQLRLLTVPYPGKIAVIGAEDEFDLSQLELPGAEAAEETTEAEAAEKTIEPETMKQAGQVQAGP